MSEPKQVCPHCNWQVTRVCGTPAAWMACPRMKEPKPRPVAWCPECRSAGVVGIEQDECPTCKGTGKVET